MDFSGEVVSVKGDHHAVGLELVPAKMTTIMEAAGFQEISARCVLGDYLHS